MESVCRGNSTEGSNPSLSANVCTDLGRRDNPVGTQRLSLRFYGSARGCGLIQNCGPPPSTAPQIMPPRHVAASMRFGACELALHEGLLPAPLGTPPGALRRSRPQRLASQVPVLNSDSERRAPAPQHRASGRADAERAVPCAGRWQRRARLGDRRCSARPPRAAASPRNKIEDVLAHTNQPVTVAELRQACRMRTTHVCQACSRSRAAFTGFESRSP